MASFNHIVVATDLGECSQPAVDLAIRLALQGQAQLTLVHVLEAPTYAYGSDRNMTVGFFIPLAEIAQKLLNEALERVQRRVPAASALMVQGTAWAELLRVAEEKNADVLVLGTHGHRGVTRMMLGSVAEKVVRMATLPVLTVRMPTSATATGDGAKERPSPTRPLAAATREAGTAAR